MDKKEMNNDVARELNEKLHAHFRKELVKRMIEEYTEGRLLLHLGEKLDEEMKDICFGNLDEEAKSGYIEMKTNESKIHDHMVCIEKILNEYKIDVKTLFEASKVIEKFDADWEARHDGKA